MKTKQMNLNWKNAALLLGGVVGIGLADTAQAMIPQGHFIGRIDRSSSARGISEVDLLIRTVGEDSYAVQFERSGNDEFGLLLQVVEVSPGNLAFSRTFVDGSMPTLRTNGQHMLNGQYTYRPMAGGARIESLRMSFSATAGEPAYSYEAVRPNPHARLEWRDFDFVNPFFGRADGGFSGNAIGEVDSTNFTFNLSHADPAAVPCGLSSGRIELLPYSPGVSGARLINSDLEREGAYNVARSLFGVVIPLRKANYVERYNEVKFITFADEACVTETRLEPGSPISTRVITFHERRVF